jgi:hypothetical protein
MNARTLIAVVCTTVLAACAGGTFVVNERFFPGGVTFIPLDAKANVMLQDDTIVVNREPFKVRATKLEGRWQEITLTFKLVGHATGYEFAPFEGTNPLKWASIPNKTYDPLGDTTCTLIGDRSEMACRFTPKGNDLYYAYTLRVKKPDGGYILSDPSMMI